MKVKCQFKKQSETQNTYRYGEVSSEGNFLQQNESMIGTLYVRKAAFPKGAPEGFTCELDTEGKL